MRPYVVIPIYAVVACACLGAQAQSNAPATDERNRAVEAVDVSVHADVDGQPHEKGNVESSRERPTPLPTAKRPPASLVWPAGADTPTAGTGQKAGQVTFGISSFHPGTQMGASISWQVGASATSATEKNDDSGQGRSGVLKAQPAHSFDGSATPPLSPRASVPTVPASDRTEGLSAPFGRGLAAFPGSTDSFQANRFSYHKGRGVKRNRQYPRKSGTKSSQAGLSSP